MRLRMRMRRKFTHLDFRVAPPQRYTWGRSPITVSRTGLEFVRRCARSDPGGRRREGKAPLSHCTKASLRTDETNVIFIMITGQVCAHILKHKSEIEINETTVTNDGSSWVEPILELLCCFPTGPLLPHRPQINHPIYSLLLYSNRGSERVEEMPVWEEI